MQLLVSRSNVVLLRLKAKKAAFSNASEQEKQSFSARLWSFYSQSLHDRPLFTKTTLAALIFFVSDSATQQIHQEEDNNYQLSRALSGAAFGIVATTWLHYWWGFLETFVGARLPLSHHRLANTMTKVLLDQGIGAPCYIYSYYVLTNFFQSLGSVQSTKDAVQSWNDTNAKAQEFFWPTMLQHWKLWPIVHTFNFYYAPLHHRVLVQNTVLVGWSGYLSHLNHSAQHIMTPKQELEATVRRRETQLNMDANREGTTRRQKTLLVRTQTEQQLPEAQVQ